MSVVRGRYPGNSTVDVVAASCWPPYDTLACIRSTVLTTAAGITVVFVIAKIIKYHAYRHTQIQHYAIFYTTALYVTVSMGGFMMGHRYPQLELTGNLLKLLQLSVVCHLHWATTARAAGNEGIVQHAINPGLCLFAIYCIAVALMGMVDVTNTWHQCRKPYWLMLSSVDVVTVQLFAVVGLYVTHKVHALPAMTFRAAQRRDLLTVIVAFEISALFSLIYDLLMRFVGTDSGGCSGVFGHSQVFYSATELVFSTGKLLVPTWALLAVFRPVDDSGRSRESQQGGYSLDGTPTSVRSSIRGFHQYHRMSLPEAGNVFTVSDVPPAAGAAAAAAATAAAAPDVVCAAVPVSAGTPGRPSLHMPPITAMATISEESSINCSY